MVQINEASSRNQALYQLMDRYIDGDQRAFVELHTRLTPRVRSRLSKMVRNQALIEDLLQLTFMRAHQARERFAASSSPNREDRAVEAWYLAIARNVALDHLRYQYRQDRRHATLEARGELEGMGVAGVSLDPEEVSLDVEWHYTETERVREALERLPPNQREVVELHKLGGMSMAEIAHRLGVRPGALRVRAHRAYKALAGILQPAAAA